MIAFGPVPSRRLGRSLGINNIPPKYCTYSCVYCQAGKTDHIKADRNSFYIPEDIYSEVQELVIKSMKMGHKIDYFTIVTDGEPTMDINLGKTIDLLKFLGPKIALITNGSLLSHPDVQYDLMKTDYLSLKIDTMNEDTWHTINRPHGRLKLSDLSSSLIEFSSSYDGTLVTETMLVEGINTSIEEINKVALFIAELNPEKAYLSIPTRPPAEDWVKCPDESTITRMYQIFNKTLGNAEYLIEYEGDEFIYTSDVEKELLSITSVHPMRSEAVEYFLNQAQSDWEPIHKLIAEEKIKEVEYEGHKYYIRHIPANAEVMNINHK